MTNKPVKQRYLVGHNYGQGGVWAYVLAESPQQITDAFAYVEVLHERWPWMTDAVLAELPTFDVDKPEGWLATLTKKQR